ncbi:MAG: hypothetical protein KA259_01120, partial [Caldilineaceae bacterium]|nr:hypothetical protein [Caldilineaceae bacterium]
MGLETVISVNNRADPELADAARIEVIERVGAPTTFRLEYDVDISSGDLPRLVDDRFDPGALLAILAPDRAGALSCLVKGPVHGQQIRLRHGGAGSTLAVLGADTAVIMDRETRTAQWADVADSDVVSAILANYGYRADVESTSAGHFTDKHTLIQRDSDLRFVQRLARRNGCHFWVTCDDQGVETAHFRRPVLAGEPVADLTINLDNPNLEALDLRWDVERPTSVVSAQLDLNSLDIIDGSAARGAQTVLGDLGLPAITGDTRSIHLLAPADDAGDLQARAGGLLAEADWFVQVTCQASVHNVGIPLRAHTLVNLRGAGSRHSGKYFVAGVRHVIDAAAHT